MSSHRGQGSKIDSGEWQGVFQQGSNRQKAPSAPNLLLSAIRDLGETFAPCSEANRPGHPPLLWRRAGGFLKSTSGRLDPQLAAAALTLAAFGRAALLINQIQRLIHRLMLQAAPIK